jgi:uncharacterized repeat protein (TIGR02543 family)
LRKQKFPKNINKLTKKEHLDRSTVMKMTSKTIKTLSGRILSLILVLAMVLGALQYAAPVARAANADHSLTSVYLSGAGSDSNDGATSSTPVLTFAEAKRLLNLTDGTIYITGRVTVSDSQTWDLSGYTNAMVKRNTSFDTSNDLVFLTSPGSLTLNNITIDGNKTNVTAGKGALISVNSDTALVMNSGAVLQNCNTTGKGGAIFMRGGGLTLNSGSKISGNTTTSRGGGVYTDGGSITMNGGEITGNTVDEGSSYGGGGLYLDAGAFSMRGGTIANNSATLGDAIYIYMQMFPEIGANASISGSIYLNNPTAHLIITGALTHSLTLEAETPEEGRVVAVGSTSPSYTLTAADCAKFNYNGGCWYFSLDTVYNAIKLTATLPSIPVTGVSLNKTSDTLTTGGTDHLTSTIAPTDATDQNVTWASDNTSVATVDTTGLVTAVAAGTANITVTTDDGHFIASCAVTVNPPPVYMNGVSGVDTNDGSSAATAVKTFARAKALLSATNGTILITGKLTVSDTQTWNLSDYTNAVVKRDASFTGSNDLISLSSPGNLTLSNIIIDGNNVTTSKSIISVNSGVTLTLNSGAILRNAKSTGNCGAVYVNGGSLTMNAGSQICGNTTTKRGAGVYLDQASGSFTMNGGEISGNTATGSYGGGGVWINNGAFSLSGGTIANNSAPAGDAIYVYGATAYPSIGSAANVSGVIYFNTTAQSLNITGALTNSLTLKSASPAEGLIIARGAASPAYSLTAADLAKCICGNSTWKLALDTANNAICLTGVRVTGVSLNKTTDTIGIGGSHQLTATVAPADANNKNVTWYSDNTAAATVSSTGLVAGIALGTANISATTVDGEFAASCEVTVTEPSAPVSGVTLNKTSSNMLASFTEQLTATVSPGDAANKNVNWSSDNTSAATVGGTGLVTAVAAGTANITATTVDGGFTAACAVTVFAFPLTNVYLDGSSGNDSNLGTSAGNAVLTFARAKALLSHTDGTIFVTNQITVSAAEAWDLSGYTNAIVKRDASYNKTLISIPAGGSLTLDNIIIDGNKANVITARRSLIEIMASASGKAAGILVLNSGAVLQNTKSTGSGGAISCAGSLIMNAGSKITGNESSGEGAGIIMSGTVTLNGGEISGNISTSTSYGGAGVFVSAGTFIMSGGTIANNSALNLNGGGIFIYPSSANVTISGGSITGNTVTSGGYGDAIYINNSTTYPAIGPNANISGVIYFNTITDYLNITGQLTNNFTVQSVTPSEGLVVAMGSTSPAYSLTSADRARFSYNGGGWYFALDTANNAIKLTATAPILPVTGVNLNKSTDTLLIGTTDQLTATITPSDATNQNISWSSDNTLVANVSSSGLVTAMAAGTANITVTTADGGFTATCSVTVNVPAFYLNGATGLDTNDGAGPATAVKTFARAKALLNTTGGTIYITGTVTVSGTESWNLTGYANTKVVRHTGFTDYLVEVPEGASLTLSNITIDGNKGEVLAAASLVRVKGSLVMNDGASIQNNISNNVPGAVLVSDSGAIFTMNGGRISGNELNYKSGGSTRTGGAGLSVGPGTFIMNGGEISGNTAYCGGGIRLTSGVVTLNGGSISGNTATYGEAVVLFCSASTLNIIPAAVVSGSIFLNDGAACPNITGALTVPMTVECETPSAGLVVARGSGYTLTADDLAKVGYNNEGCTLGLDTANNTIYLAGVATYNVTVDGSLSGGSLTLSATSGYANMLIAVTVTADSDKQLADNSLKYTMDGGSTWTVVDPFKSAYRFKLPAADTVVTAQFEIPTPSLSVVYLNGLSNNYDTDEIGGSDSYSGSSVDNPVMTFARAKSRLSLSGGTIIITGEVMVKDSQTWDLTGYPDSMIKREGGYIRVSGEDASLTLSDIIIDGNKGTTTGTSIDVNSGSLILNDGAVLQNSSGGAVYLSNATFTMNGGSIINNEGGVYASFMDSIVINGGTISYNNGGIKSVFGKFTMNGGSIHDNRGQGVYFSGEAASRFVMNGGQIYNNVSASDYDGAGIYLRTSYVIELNGGSLFNNTNIGEGYGELYIDPNFSDIKTRLGPGFSVSGIFIYHATDTDYLEITGALTNPLSVVIYPTYLGSIAKGSTSPAYTLTAADLAKFSYAYPGYTLSLDTANNAIVLTQNQYQCTMDGSISGGSLAFSPDLAVEKTEITVNITPDSGKQMVDGSLKYSADGGSTWTAISRYAKFKMPVADVIVTARFEDSPVATLTDVYFASYDGLDAYSGSSAYPVRTFARAKGLLNPAGGTIWTKGTNITSSESWDLSGYTGALVQRLAGSSGSFIVVSSGGSLTLSNITLDGNKTSVNASYPLYPLIYVNGGSLTMNDGAVLQNNRSNQYAGAVFVTGSGSLFTLNGGLITGNESTATSLNNQGGGVNIASTGTFVMNGGEISGNISPNGGGIFTLASACTLNGGRITGNTVTAGGYGGAIYIGGSSIRPSIGSNAEITGSIYLSNTWNYLKVKQALTQNLTVESVTPSEGLVVAKGLASPVYTLTGADLSRFSYNGGGWYFTLDTANNAIKLTATSPSTVPVSGVSLNQSTSALTVNGSEQLTATISPFDASNQNVTWTSDNESVANVSNTGLVTAVSTGTAGITVTTEDGGFTAACAVTVIAPAWDGTVDVTWYNTTDKVFYLNTPAQLAGLAAIVNGHLDPDVTPPEKIIGNYSEIESYWTGIDDFNGKTIYLTADLDMGGVYNSQTGAWSGPNYTPVGGQWPPDINDCGVQTDTGFSKVLSTSFNGTLDGLGHTVRNIYFSRWQPIYGNCQSAGLVGRLGLHDNDPPSRRADNPCVRNVAVTGYIFGNRSIGGIVGKIGKTSGLGTIENCANFATIKNTDAKGCGGIVGAGWNAGIVKNCYNAGDVSSTYKCPTGGIVGSNEIPVINCYSVGHISALQDSFAMGIGTNNNGSPDILNCYWLTGTAPGGGYYQGKCTTVYEVTANYLKSSEFLAALNGDGRAFVADTLNINNGYPILRVQTADASTLTGITKDSDPLLSYVEGLTFDTTSLAIWANYSDGTREKVTSYTVSNSAALRTTVTTINVSGSYHGTPFSYDFTITVAPALQVNTDNFYELSSAAEMLWFAGQVNSGLTTINGQLMNDIDLSKVSWPAIGSNTNAFAGIFDGNGHTVTIILDQPFFPGLFRYLGGGTVRNLTLTGRVAGDDIGGLVYSATNSTMENCVNNAAVTGKAKVGGIVSNALGTTTITGCTNNGAINGTSQVGGIAGYFANTGTINNCSNSGAVSGTTERIGGIVGDSAGTGTISRCINTGTITANDTSTTAIGNCVGGVAGYLQAASMVDQSYNAGAVEGGMFNVGGVVGIAQDAGARVTNCYNLGSVTSLNTSNNARTGGVVAYTSNSNCTVQNCYNAGDIIVNNSGEFTAGIVGYAADNMNIGNNYYLNTTASKGLGNAADNTESKTSAQLAVLAPDLGEYYKSGALYPILTWQSESPIVSVTGVSLNKSIAVLSAGGTDRLMATVTPTNATNKNVTWTSDNTDVATVSGSGLVTGIVAGTAHITVTTEDGGFTASCTVTVNPVTSHNITMAPVPDPIWTVTADKATAQAGETVTVTVSDTAYTSWATGLVVTGTSTATYPFNTITAATGNADKVNGAGVYSFTMPAESVTVGFTANYSALDIYVRAGSGVETLVHSYTRTEMETLAAANTNPVYYAVWDRLPDVFMGKAVRYVTIPQLVNSAHTYNSSVRYDDSSCTMTGLSLDGWTTNMPWTYLMDTTRQYYASLGDQYLDETHRTGLDREVPPVLAIAMRAGRTTMVDTLTADTYWSYRFFYGQTEAEYGNGIPPTTDEMNARCTANNSAYSIYRLTFVVQPSYTVTYISNGSTYTTQSAASGSSVNAPADPVREGYTFAGWYSNQSLTAPVTFPCTVTANVTFYAKWTLTNPSCSLSLSPESQTVNAGDTFNVAVSIDTGVAVRGWQLNVNFDASKLIANSVTEGSFLSDWAADHTASTASIQQMAINNNTGNISNIGFLLAGSTTGGPSGSGTLCTVSFTAKQDVIGNADIGLSGVVLSDTNQPPQHIEGVVTTGGSVTIHASGSETLAVNLTAGWNTFSTPVILDPDLDTLNDLLPGDAYDAAYGFDASTQSWKLINGNYQVQPCAAIYIKMKSARNLTLTINSSLTAPPSKELLSGWNLISLANLERMKVNEALTSVYESTGGVRGYSQVISQGVGSQKAWTYTRDQVVSETEKGWLEPGKGYWVFMDNPDTLAGFSITP